MAITLNDIKNGLTYIPRAIATDAERLYKGSRDVAVNGKGANLDIGRRDYLKGTGFVLGAGMTNGGNAVNGALDASPVGVQNPFTFEGGEADNNEPEERSEEINFVNEICGMHAEQDSDVQNYMEDILGSYEKTEGSFENVEVDGSTMRFEGSKLGDFRISGDSTDFDQFGTTPDYAKLLEQAYQEDQDQFVEGLEQIYDGECR